MRKLFAAVATACTLGLGVANAAPPIVVEAENDADKCIVAGAGEMAKVVATRTGSTAPFTLDDLRFGSLAAGCKDKTGMEPNVYTTGITVAPLMAKPQ
jgi:hypothetical protein